MVVPLQILLEEEVGAVASSSLAGAKLCFQGEVVVAEVLDLQEKGLH